jgi:hypothetical protein
MFNGFVIGNSGWFARRLDGSYGLGVVDQVGAFNNCTISHSHFDFDFVAYS